MALLGGLPKLWFCLRPRGDMTVKKNLPRGAEAGQKPLQAQVHEQRVGQRPPPKSDLWVVFYIQHTSPTLRLQFPHLSNRWDKSYPQQPHCRL